MTHSDEFRVTCHLSALAHSRPINVPLREEAFSLLGLAQVFHKFVAERRQHTGTLRRLEPGAIRLAHGPRAVEAQLEGGGLHLSQLKP